MTAVKLVTLVCDYPDCGSSIDTAEGHAEGARYAAAKSGWIATRSGSTVDLCPAHRGGSR
jgi:hypothetical protein